MKRKAALLLAAVMASSCMSVTGYAANFKDADDVPWEGAKATISTVADLGLLSGYEDNTFRAKNNVTYAEAMQMLYNVLQKTGRATSISAADVQKYSSVFSTYNIPAWAQTAVAYGLENNILRTSEVASFMTGKTSNAASRQTVATFFGRALAFHYETDRNATEAYKFADFNMITGDSIVLVDLLARLDILNGDDNNCFNPHQNINRAEMAVMLNKTYNVLTEGVGTTGTITEFSYDGYSYLFTVKSDTGSTMEFYARTGSVTVYQGNTDETVSLSRLAVGDRISYQYVGGVLQSIRLLEGSTTQAKYDITGYLKSISGSQISFESESTGETEKLDVGSGCTYYLEGQTVRRQAIEDALDENYDQHAYVGINIKVEVEKEGSSLVEKTYVTEVHVTFSDEYTRTGRVDKMNSSNITYKPVDGSTSTTVSYASDCVFMIDDKEVSVDDAMDMVDAGTTYVKVTIGKTEMATIVQLSDTSFSSTQTASTTTYTVKGFTSSKLVLEASGEKYTYNFGSDNPLNNITFSTWNASEGEWEDVNQSTAESYYDDFDDDDDKVYCRLAFNSGGKIKTVELSNKKGAWTSSGSTSYTDREGTIESLSGNTLKFKNSSKEYTLLSQYNKAYSGSSDSTTITGEDRDGNDVKNPLIVNGTTVSSLTVFKKIAGADDVTVYAEIEADGNNVIQKLEARVTGATGEIVSYEYDDKELTIKTSDGTEISFQTIRNPDTEDDDLEAEDIAANKYVGATVKLGFNSDGVVNKIVLDGTSTSDSSMYVSGVAVAAANGLELENSSKTYTWASRSNISINNYSMSLTSLDSIKKLIEDDDVTVYVRALLEDGKKVIGLDVYVREAEGTFREYDDDLKVIRITTSDGNNFSFEADSKVDINIDGIAESKLNSQAVGKKISISFNNNGFAEEITG